eukprot:tig00021434_g21334.t1
MLIGARVIVVGKTYGPLSSGESQAEAWSESPGLERRAGVQLASPSCQVQPMHGNHPTGRRSRRANVKTGRGHHPVLLADAPQQIERILYASVDLRPLDRPRKENDSPLTLEMCVKRLTSGLTSWTSRRRQLRRRSQGKVLASCLPSRAERDAEPHVLWMQVESSGAAAERASGAVVERKD